MVKQVFLLDDATVRERVAEMVGLGAAALDPPEAAISARTIVVPTALLLRQFDAYLLELADALQAAVSALDPTFDGTVLRHLDA